MNTRAVLARCRAALELKTNKALAAHMNISEAGLSSHIARQTVPYRTCVAIAEQTGVSLDWLILGKEPPEPPTTAEAALLHGWRQLNPAQRADFLACLFQHLDVQAE